MDELENVRAYYARDEERERLGSGVSRIEFERTKQILARALPSPPAIVADIGGGPGAYAIWLASLGYSVRHRDLMPNHVDHVRRDAASAGVDVESVVADARSLDLDDESVDAVLLLGPLYHLVEREWRLEALREARRIVRPGGVVFAAAITRWALRLDGIATLRIDREFPAARSLIDEAERTGVIPPLEEGGFTGYTHRPEDLREEVAAAGLEVEDLVAVEGIAFAYAGDIDERLATPDGLEVLVEVARAIERVPELIGLGTHLLVTARRSREAELSTER
jgi:SAM-dependent methyltransferase